MIEQIVKTFNTKREALNYMQIMDTVESILVNQNGQYLVVCKKQIAVVDGECERVVFTS